MKKEIILITGYSSAGKSTLLNKFVKKGYQPINLKNPSLDLIINKLNKNYSKIALFGEYITINDRKPIIKLAKKFNFLINCVWLNTSFKDALFNTCLKMIQKKGKVLSPEDFENDLEFFSPVKLFEQKKIIEENKNQFPSLKEGFNKIKKINFKRNWSKEYKNKALILDFDDTLRFSKGKNKWPECPEDVAILPNRKKILKNYLNQKYKLLGVSNQSAIHKGLPESRCISCFEETIRQLEIKIEYLYCPHKSSPISCYCRKPLPALGVYWIEKYKLNPKNCIMVGDNETDKEFAKNCGFKYIHPDLFFS
jgi:HAD superfamily hydrolase (TIGR01662 family)